MTGSELIQKVREETGDLSYDTYEDINRAYEEICEICNPYWLSETKEGLLNFETNVSEYYVDFSDMRSLQNIYIYGEYNGETRWRLLKETDEVTFLKHQQKSSEYNGDDITSIPMYYKLEGSPLTKISVTPTPDNTYTTRFHYTVFPKEIGPNDEPKIPPAYHRKISLLASGYILRRSDNPARVQEGLRLIRDVTMSFKNLFRDTKPNRSGRIQPPQVRRVI